MSSPTNANRSDHRRSISATQGVPMSIFNPQLIDEARRTSANKERNSTGTSQVARSNSSRHSRRSHHKVVSVSVTAAVVSHDNSNDESDRRIRRSMSTHHVDLPSLQYRPPKTERTNTTESSTTKDQSSYTRPVGPELVSIKQPSCTGLPPQWTVVHDRFIAYLATHAPLDRTGKVQRREESRERWRNDDITRLVMERFVELDGCIKACMIENRLALLDQAGDNDYFKMPYGAYKYEKWGWGV